MADVATEYDPETEQPFYREVIVTVPRQCGKTTLVLCVELDRCLAWGRPQRVAYSAQTGQDARLKLIQDQAPILEASPLSSAVRQIRKAQGAECIVFKTSSRIEVLTGDKGAGHGRTLDLGVIDEAFDDTDDRREGAMLPAMRTRPGAQLLIVSTAGTHESVYLRRKIEMGRQAAEDGVTEGLCYFEWSVPDGADPDDEALWWDHIPALDDTGVKALRHARRSMADGEFRRAFLNQWTAAAAIWMTEDLWDACAAKPNIPDRAEGVVLGVDIGVTSDSSAVATVWRDGQGIFHVESKVWTPDKDAHEHLDLGIIMAYIREQATRYPGCAITYDKHFFEYPAQVLSSEGFNMIEWGQNNSLMCPATQTLFEAVANGRIRHGGDPVLRRHALNAATKRTELGLRVSKLPSKEHIDALVALMTAVEWLARQTPPRRSVYETRDPWVI